jgi:hypothetical protein
MRGMLDSDRLPNFSCPFCPVGWVALGWTLAGIRCWTQLAVYFMTDFWLIGAPQLAWRIGPNRTGFESSIPKIQRDYTLLYAPLG